MGGYNAPWPRTILDDVVRQSESPGPGCVEYAQALLRALDDRRNPLPARLFSTCLLGNHFDCHTLVEMYLPSQGEWALLDPTFGITVRRRLDGRWATAADVALAVSDHCWTAIEPIGLTSAGLKQVSSYYIDYPLLVVSPFGEKEPTTDGEPFVEPQRRDGRRAQHERRQNALHGPSRQAMPSERRQPLHDDLGHEGQPD